MAFKTAAKIWLLALLLSSISFVMYVALNETQFDAVDKGLAFGLALNLILSIPPFLLMWAVLDICIKAGLQGMNLLLVVLICSVAFAVLTFVTIIRIFEIDHSIFLYTSVISVVIAVIIQHHALLNLTSSNQSHSHEN